MIKFNYSEITTLSETIYSKDYDTYIKGNSVFQNPTTPTLPTKQSSSYATSTLISLVKFISNNKFYQANLKDVA